ncbi:thiamine phosphate synthase [Croceivirga sp. JEA036]|uniref:thiamine phosphate synthase n=1 Tax=Croceivirga sp. JEA036 TaxID=2721162 RepID=UPI00143AF064|nr:thiamine phosphate synthase [Croceivirga sp. JEA036]NJB35424.1 thiamine phosphate synthase [Croceivirga sp. JEA036]
MKTKIDLNTFKLQYISQGSTVAEHLQNIEAVLTAGCQWIQLRLKDTSASVYEQAAQEAKKLTDAHNAVLIINDNVAVAKAVNATGVHLGLTDTSLEEARLALGEDAIIGGTANTLEDCSARISSKADYIGLGPFRFTATKKNLSPILGVTGFQQITTALSKNGANIPIVAIGGITPEDVAQIATTGVSGVAVSGILSGQPKNLKTITAQFLNTTYHGN